MASTVDLAAIGELIVDLVQVDPSPSGQAQYRRSPEGSPACVVVTASSLGLSTAFMGKVGADPQGAFLRAQLDAGRVDTSSLVSEPYAFTTMSFDETGEDGRRLRSYVRKPGADALLRPEEVNVGLARSCRVLHFGSMSLTDDPARAATLLAIEEAETAGALISYDPNYRPGLWKSHAAAADEMSDMLSHADLVKLGREEVQAIFGTENLEEAAYAALARGPRLVAITRGAEGALMMTRGAQADVAAFSAEAVDASGAGDVFWGAALAWLIGAREVRTAADLDALKDSELASCARYACAAASVSVERVGSIASVPTAREVAERLARG